MSATAAAALSPETVLAEMKKHGVTHVVYLPDSETNWLYLLMKADPAVHLVGVGREGNACSIAAGLWLGGAKPLILIQNTGMLEAGDSIRGWLMSLNVPVVLMVGYRGWTRHGVTTDTVATYTERFLMAFGLNYYLVENDADSDAHRDRLRGGGTHPAAGRDPGRRRISRLQPIARETCHDAHCRYDEGLRPLTAATRSSFPAAAAATGSTSATITSSTWRSATRRWAGMPGSASVSRWPGRTKRSCCSIPRATS